MKIGITGTETKSCEFCLELREYRNDRKSKTRTKTHVAHA